MSNADPAIIFPARQDGALHELGYTQLMTAVQVPPPGTFATSARWEEAARYRRISVFVRYTPLLAGGGLVIYPKWHVDGPGIIGQFDDMRIDPATGQSAVDTILTPLSPGLAAVQWLYSLWNPGGCQWLFLAVSEQVHASPNNGTCDLWVRAGG
jgi:hypothetical protein